MNYVTCAQNEIKFGMMHVIVVFHDQLLQLA